MVGDSWDSKDDHKVILDIEVSQASKQTPDVTASGGKGLWATTSRRELWSFYLYYVVRCILCMLTLRFLTSI